MDTGEYVDYHGMSSYAHSIDQAIDYIEELLDEGHSAAAIELCEHALKAVEGSMEAVDDSDIRARMRRFLLDSGLTRHQVDPLFPDLVDDHSI